MKLAGLILFLFFDLISAQNRPDILVKSLGFGFGIPKDWKVTGSEGNYILSHDRDPGFILVTTHTESSLDAMRQSLLRGLQDGPGTSLLLSSNPVSIHPNGYGAVFSGLLGYQPAKVFMLSLFNDHGVGINIVCGASPALYTSHYKELALEIAVNTRFFHSELADLIKRWKLALNNSRLTFLKGPVTSTESIMKETMDLCASGQFAYEDQSISTKGHGQWKISASRSGQPLLKLEFEDGHQFEYILATDGEKTYLNDQRYFRSFNNELTAFCQR